MVLVRARADAKGRYAMDGLRVPGAYAVFALSGGKVVGRSDPVYLTEAEPRAELDVHFRALVDLRIKIVRHDQTPVRRARIGFDDKSGWPSAWPSDWDPDGDAWRIRALRPGTYDLLVWPEGCPPTSRRVVLRAGPTMTVTIRTQAGVTLAGRLVDDRGKPLADYPLAFEVKRGRGVRAHVAPARTDEEGRFRIEGLQRASGRISIGRNFDFWRELDERSQTYSADPVYPGAWIDAVTPGGPPRDYRLRRRGVLRVRLPSGPRTVIASFGTNTREYSYTTCELDEDRRLEFIAPEGRFDLRVGEPPHLYYLRDLSIAAGTVRDLGELPLARLETLKGRVKTPSGEAVCGGTISLAAPRLLQVSAEIGHDGTFVLPNLPVGLCTIRIWVDGFGPQDRELDVRVGAGAHEFHLLRSARVRIRLVDRAGIPVSGAWLSLGREGSQAHFLSTNRRGVLEYDLVAGSWAVVCEPDRWTVTLRSGETADVVLRRSR